jgi:hypothetical protein
VGIGWNVGCGDGEELGGGAVGWQDARLSDELRGIGGFEAGGRGQATRLGL